MTTRCESGYSRLEAILAGKDVGRSSERLGGTCFARSGSPSSVGSKAQNCFQLQILRWTDTAEVYPWATEMSIFKTPSFSKYSLLIALKAETSGGSQTTTSIRHEWSEMEHHTTFETTLGDLTAKLRDVNDWGDIKEFHFFTRNQKVNTLRQWAQRVLGLPDISHVTINPKLNR